MTETGGRVEEDERGIKKKEEESESEGELEQKEIGKEKGKLKSSGGCCGIMQSPKL